MTSVPTSEKKPWPALWALIIGFFMILVDSTIVSVANPTIMEKLQTDYEKQQKKINETTQHYQDAEQEMIALFSSL